MIARRRDCRGTIRTLRVRAEAQLLCSRRSKWNPDTRSSLGAELSETLPSASRETDMILSVW